MKSKTKKKTKVLTRKPQVFDHQIGDIVWVDNVRCEIRFINQDTGFLSPTFDDPEDRLVARHICIGTVDSYGKVSRL